MTPLLQQFLSESRDFLEGIGEKLMQLERDPQDAALMSELFRLVHTLKGNSGLFDFPEMSRALHAAEDVMAAVREGSLPYSRTLADRLLETMDFVSSLLDEIEIPGNTDSSSGHAASAVRLAQSLRELISIPGDKVATPEVPNVPGSEGSQVMSNVGAPPLADVPEELRMAWHRQVTAGQPLLWISYVPEPDCFFKGEDPFFQARQTPQTVWQRALACEPWPPLGELDAFRCVLRFELVSMASRTLIEEHFRYVPEQITIVDLQPNMLSHAERMPTFPAPGLPGIHGLEGRAAPVPAPVNSIADAVIRAQLTVLGMSDQDPWLTGRLKSVAATLSACYLSLRCDTKLPAIETALGAAIAQASAAPLLNWLTQETARQDYNTEQENPPHPLTPPEATVAPPPAVNGKLDAPRRSEDSAAAIKTLKVDQVKVDNLMNLIGELVVAKNGLPFLAARAETAFGVRELSREIKAQYAVINRIAEEMQNAIMQVRMMPVSAVFQRFPRLARDLSRKLGKEVQLVLEGEDTEADKTIIEALADPLIHIIRNSLDHGIELPEVRRTAGKPSEGRLVIHASQQADRVVIDISDDGKGIDPAAIKRKAYEKGLIDEAALERISDQEAINLVFAAGFSTVDVVSDLSGRGVGMDVVRTAVEQVNGTVTLESTLGQGTRIRLSLPLSMAVTNVMIIESDRQIFGVPMDIVLETVRVPRSAIRTIKNRLTTVLRGRIVPLLSLNELLARSRPQQPNNEDQLATLVVRIQGEHVGILVDDFREVVDIILKPMTGILGDLPGCAGSALLGDGSVLMVLNPQELMA
jgi:two-component system, chemotaxis family, sensor kinase CheA